MKRRAIVQWTATAFIAPGALRSSRTDAAGAHRLAYRQNASVIPDTMFLGNPAHTGGQPGPGPAGEPVERWRLESERWITSTPLISGGVLYVGGVDKRFTALDAATGTVSWQVDLGMPISGSPGIADGLVITGTSDAASGEGAFLVALDAATGEERWRIETPEGADAAPAVADGIVFAGTDSGALLALDAVSGSEAWRYDFPGDVDSAPVVAEGVVYVGSQGAPGIVAAIDAASGESRWTFEVPKPVVGPPSLAEGTIYIGCTDGFLYALDAASGAERWRFESGEFIPSSFGDAAPAISGVLLYLGDRGGRFYGIDIASGAEIFRVAADSSEAFESTPAVVDGIVYASSEDGGLYAFDASTGERRWRYEVGAKARTSPLVSGGLIFVGGETAEGTGILLALGDPPG